MAVDFIKTDDLTAYLLGQSRTSSLEEVDAAHWSWFHFKVCLIAGVGFFTDAYDIFAINIAATMINYVYNQGQEPRAPLGPLLKASAPVGTLVGQLLFGRLADVAGRKRMYGVELIIIIIGTFGQALSAKGAIQTLNLYAILIVWRFIMGLGIGGDYPLSAVISSEFAPSHIRGRMMTAVFANQGWGQLSASIVGVLVLLGFKNSATGRATVTALQLQQDVDRAWRIILGLGCVPAAIALYFRLTIPETPRFTMDIERNVEQARKDIEGFLQTGKYKYDPDSMVIRVNAPRASFRDFVQYFRHWRNGMLLFGCAYSWFAIDVAFYGIGLNTDKFFCSIGFAQSVNTFDDFINLCVANMFFSGVGLVLGYWATFCVIDNVKWGGRKRIQMMGFAMLSVLFLIMGTLTKLSPGSKAMLALFCLAGFFLNFGPNTTTFIIPGELFPTRYRSTCHGLSAASGKLGAIISQFGIVGPLSTAHALFVFVAFTLTGLGATCLVEETNRKTLEHMSGEPQESFINGVSASLTFAYLIY
ncbi:hypothetical protein PHLGIDRAFT_25025 [Phlebiopsis gigantea 11061_1 CR5-6]|uniref:Major facilitator superfamily (MFS) profile domain-containing protein n=1 Tax=Phlebiopsis gigantea (strain 11061_1 CR5-6) TaxID=745531 RepID=A0A0C3S5D3_PHLG1|nr:hypothetical protein PHLGIDRAFT_25025 [Phlebiopsis gigantea 11061_1 CR5-6]